MCIVFYSAKNLAKLQVLELDHMSKVTKPVAIAMTKNGLRGLQVLIFRHTPVTTKAILQFNGKLIDQSRSKVTVYCVKGLIVIELSVLELLKLLCIWNLFESVYENNMLVHIKLYCLYSQK